MNTESNQNEVLIKKKKFFDTSLFTLKDNFGKLNLFRLAIPQFLDLFFINFLSVISTIVINKISSGSAVAVDSAGKLLNIIVVITTFINTGTSIMLSIYMGKNDEVAVKKLCYINLLLTTIVSLSLSFILFLFARKFALLMRLKGVELEQSVKYIRIRSMFLFLSSLANCFNTIMRCYGDSKPTFYSGIVSALVSTSLNILAISKFSPIKDSLSGVAVASNLGAFTSFIISGSFFVAKKIKLIPKFSGKLIKQMFKVGFPGGVSSLSYNLSQVITTSFINTLSPIQKNTKVYISSLLFIIYLFGYSIGNADAIMVGRHCGSGNVEKADKMHKQNILIGLFSNFTLSLLFLASHRLLFKIYTSDTETLNLIFIILVIDCFVEMGRSLNHLGEFSLNGVGDVYATTIISMSSCWLVSVLFAYVLGIVCHLGLIGIWLAFALDETTRGILYLLRWKSGKWKTKFLENKI